MRAIEDAAVRSAFEESLRVLSPAVLRKHLVSGCITAAQYNREMETRRMTAVRRARENRPMKATAAIALMKRMVKKYGDFELLLPDGKSFTKITMEPEKAAEKSA